MYSHRVALLMALSVVGVIACAEDRGEDLGALPDSGADVGAGDDLTTDAVATGQDTGSRIDSGTDAERDGEAGTDALADAATDTDAVDAGGTGDAPEDTSSADGVGDVDAPEDILDNDTSDADPDAPDPDPYSGTPCATGSLSGACQWLWRCGSGMQSIPGLCPGPSEMQCCVHQSTDPNIGTPCAVNGVAGVCLDVSDCTGDDVTPTSGLCPGPSSVQCCAATPTSSGDTCDPAAHPLPNAGLSEAPGDPGCPNGMVGVTASLCIDRYEASLVEVLADGSVQSWSPYFNPGARTTRAMSIAAAVPQGYINGAQAAAACAGAQKRLCTDTEWLRACQGSPATTYPYGDTRQPSVCNDARAVHPAVEYFGTSASWIFSRIDHPCLNQLPDSLALTDDHPGCVTDEGALDMMGNLHEWTADPAGTFRGGFYVDTYRNGNGCLYRTTAHDTSHWDYSTGFRCCADRQ